MVLERATGIPVDYRYMGLLLRAAEDLEVGLGDFASEVPADTGAVSAQEDMEAPRQTRLITWRIRTGASRSGARTTQVLEVMIDQANRGQVLRLSEEEGRRRFPGLIVASLEAMRKEKPEGVITAPVLFDGTHGIAVNHRTRIRDQERAPIAADLKRVMREKSKTDEPTFALTADVTEAHRQVPIDEQAWHLLGCQVRPGEEVFVNTFGTFGIASASYYWSRVASAIGRLCQYMAGTSARTWHLLVVDDYHPEAAGPQYRASIMVFIVLCSVLGVPLPWRKTAGGDTVSWVGFD